MAKTSDLNKMQEPILNAKLCHQELLRVPQSIAGESSPLKVCLSASNLGQLPQRESELDLGFLNRL